jgi:hypothetical protein
MRKRKSERGRKESYISNWIEDEEERRKICPPPQNITRLKISTTLHERKAPPKNLLDKIFFHPIHR